MDRERTAKIQNETIKNKARLRRTLESKRRGLLRSELAVGAQAKAGRGRVALERHLPAKGLGCLAPVAGGEEKGKKC